MREKAPGVGGCIGWIDSVCCCTCLTILRSALGTGWTGNGACGTAHATDKASFFKTVV